MLALAPLRPSTMMASEPVAPSSVTGGVSGTGSVSAPFGPQAASSRSSSAASAAARQRKGGARRGSGAGETHMFYLRKGTSGVIAVLHSGPAPKQSLPSPQRLSGRRQSSVKEAVPEASIADASTRQ